MNELEIQLDFDGETPIYHVGPYEAYYDHIGEFFALYSTNGNGSVEFPATYLEHIIAMLQRLVPHGST